VARDRPGDQEAVRVLTATSATVVGTLRVRAGKEGRQSTAVQLGTRLASVRLTTNRLGPPGVLVVRRVDDPMPRVLRAHGPGPEEAAWERAVRGVLDQMVAAAARPAVGPVPPTAPAVVFADWAEVLACLASDWLAGDLPTRWWWHHLVGPGQPPDDPVRAWLRAPLCVPAALDLLAGRGEVVTFARRLPPPAAAAVATAVAGAFDVAERRPAATPETRPQAARRPGGTVAPGHHAPPGTLPWESRVPEAEAEGLSAEQRLLLGLGLVIRRAPRVTREPGFWLAAHAWAARLPAKVATRPAPDTAFHAGIGGRGRDRARPTRTRRAPSGSRPAPAGTGAGREPGRLPAVMGRVAVVTRGGRRARDRVDAGRGRSGDPAPGIAAAVEEQAARAGGDGRRRPTRPMHGQPISVMAPAVSSGTASRHREQDAATVPRPEGVVDTRLGGLFYLINLGQGLGLYGDFTTPASPGIDLDLWDFVTLLGRRLLGRPVPSDPVWELLAGLAGRAASQPPGPGFAPPGAWRVPADWLGPFDPAGEWRWSAAGGRLRLQHPAGFAVLDVPPDDRAAPDQLREELQPLGVPAGVPLRRRSLPPLPARPLHRWVALLGAYATARLSRALDHPAGRVGEVLLRHRARVFVTHVHVDVALSLAELPIEIRLAGLDRDPGWVPAAGRVVAFRFD
jgi:hypothetical protein